jgi:hypothetical protein
MKIAAHCRLGVVAIPLAFSYALASAAEGEVAYLPLEVETLFAVGRNEIWTMSCRGELTKSEDVLLSTLIESALPEDGSPFDEYKVRIGLRLGQDRYYFDNELRLSGPRPGVRILSESARSTFLTTLGQVLATNAACDRSTDPRQSVGRDAVAFECDSTPADATPSVQSPEEAIRRAKKAWMVSGRPEMFRQEIAKYEPYQAVLVNSTWHVYGSLGDGAIGGTPEASICRGDGHTRIWRSQ